MKLIKQVFIFLFTAFLTFGPYCSGVYAAESVATPIQNPIEYTSEWKESSPSREYKILSLAWDNSKHYIAVGTNGVIRTSSDGLSWNTRFFNNTIELLSIIYTGKEYIAVGKEGKILRTVDGSSWANSFSDPAKWFEKIAMGKDTYVAVGNTIVYSNDGVNWNEVVIPGDIASSEYIDVIYDGKRFLVCSFDGKVFSSENGKEWKLTASIPSHILSGIVWNGSKYVMLSGDTGVVFTSLDGANWSVSARTQPGLRTSIMWDGSKYIVLGDVFFGNSDGNRVMLTSTDGYSWRTRNLNVTNSGYLYKLSFDGKNYFLYDQNKFYRSLDMNEWESENKGASGNK